MAGEREGAGVAPFEDAGAEVVRGEIDLVSRPLPRDRELAADERLALWERSRAMLEGADSERMDDAEREALWRSAANGLVRSAANRHLALKRPQEMFGSFPAESLRRPFAPCS